MEELYKLDSLQFNSKIGSLKLEVYKMKLNIDVRLRQIVLWNNIHAMLKVKNYSNDGWVSCCFCCVITFKKSQHYAMQMRK